MRLTLWNMSDALSAAIRFWNMVDANLRRRSVYVVKREEGLCSRYSSPFKNGLIVLGQITDVFHGFDRAKYVRQAVSRLVSDIFLGEE
jgi:hypothetical protein